MTTDIEAPKAGVSFVRASAGVLRRLGAMVYDTLLLVALLMVVTGLLMVFTDGEAISAERVGVLKHAYQALLAFIVVVFFGWCWTRREGQTLGMTAWRLKLERADGRRVTWRDALLRLMGATVSFAALGLGYFWIWIDRHGLAWHDRWSGTRVRVMPKR